jgi:hypothetical protein
MIPTALAKDVLVNRKPRLLFRLSVVVLFRLAARRFCGLLFQEPPRTTRRGLAETNRPRRSQGASGIRMLRIGNPGADLGLDGGAVDRTDTPLVAEPRR